MLASAKVLQVALVAALKNSAPLMAQVSGVYDAPPPGVALPYVLVGEDIVRDLSVQERQGRDHLVTIQLWTEAQGARQALELGALVEAALGSVERSLAGWRVVSLKVERAFVVRTSDARYRRGVVEIRARLWSV